MPACPNFIACGGDPVGTWHYNSGCVSSERLFPIERQSCPSLTLSNLNGDARGSVVFGGSTVTQDVSIHMSGTLTIPDVCNTANDCAAVQQQVFVGGGGTLNCTGTDADCVCAFTTYSGGTSLSPYTKTSSQITTNAGTPVMKTADYCITGIAPNINFQYQEVGKNSGPWQFGMEKK